jgi:hypothetical protein
MMNLATVRYCTIFKRYIHITPYLIDQGYYQCSGCKAWHCKIHGIISEPADADAKELTTKCFNCASVDVKDAEDSDPVTLASTNLNSFTLSKHVIPQGK